MPFHIYLCLCLILSVAFMAGYVAADKVYKVWDLKNYEHLYSIHDNNIYEIKISPVSTLPKEASNNPHLRYM